MPQMATRTTAARPRLDIESLVRLTELADYIVPFTLRAICDLGIADHLVAGPRSVEHLAQLTGTHGRSLHRALRALASKGIFTECEPGTFALTPLAEPLRSDHPLTLREAYPLLAADIYAWAEFDHSVRTGEPAFDRAHGRGYWEYMAEHPEESARFDASQQAATRLEVRTVLTAYDWASLGRVLDVGGGNGAFLTSILSRFRSMSGVVYDLPHVVAGAPEVIHAAGVADRCKAIGGSFFESVPAGYDGYVLKRILYGWSDQRAVELLRRIRAAMRPDSRLLVLEPIVTEGSDFDTGKLYDLLLFAMAGGRARSPEEISALLAAAGLQLETIIPTLLFPIVVALPV